MNKMARLNWKWRNLFLPSGPGGDRSRGRLYEPHLLAFGENFKISESAFIYLPESLSVGKNVYIGFSSYIGNGEVFLDDEVLIGNHVSITAADHLRKNGSFRFGGSEKKKIYIGKGTWIAAHSCITAGVSIGSGCLVAAGTVVTKDFGNDLLIAGVPSIAIRKLSDYEA